MNNISEKLDELEEEINKAKEDKARLEGILSNMVKQLEERFGIESVKEVKELLKEVNIKIDKTDKELSDNFNELKEGYEW